ncbi:proline racemase, partial [Klebsiella pneumoniae]|nr:proline racemase [Klebsiella pneumoniae]
MIFAMKRESTYRGEIEMKVSKIYTTIDAHVAGEPLRIITGGVP